MTFFTRAFFPHHKILFGTLVVLVATVIGRLLTQRPTLADADVLVPIEADSYFQNDLVVTPNPAGLDVHLRGPADTLAGLSQEQLRYRLGEESVKNGFQRVVVDAGNIELPKGVVVADVHPRTITVRIDPLVEKNLPVEAALAGVPGQHFVVSNVVIRPDLIQVKGPKRVVDALTSIRTKPVAIGGVSKPLHRRVALDLPDEIQLAHPGQVMVEVQINAKVIVKQLKNIKLTGRGGNHSHEISPPTIAITVKGPAGSIDTLTHNPDFGVYVDLKGLGPGVYVRRAVILLPLPMALVKASPELFTIHVGASAQNGG